MANELPKYVFHEEFGEGETINGMQTIDESGDVTNTDVMFEHGIVRNVPVEELMVLEGRGRPKGSKNKPKGGETKPTMPTTKTPSNSEDDDSDGPSGPGIHGELLRHQDLGDLKHHEIEFHDGKKVKVSPEHRNKALAHIKSLMGPGKNPDTRMAALRKLGSNHETFKKMIGEEVDLDEGNKENKQKKNEYVASIIQKKLHPSVLPSLKYGRRELKKEEVGLDEGNAENKAKKNEYFTKLGKGWKKAIGYDFTQGDLKLGRGINTYGNKKQIEKAQQATKEEVEHLSEASPASLANSAMSALDKAHQLRRSAGLSTTGFDGHMNDLSDKHIEKAKRHVVALGAAVGAPKTAAATVAHIDKMHAAMKQSQHDRYNDEDFDDDNDPADHHHYNAGDNILKMAHNTHNEEVEQVDEKLIGKQKRLDKNHNGRLDRQDFRMLRKESVEPKVSVYTEANRFRSVENAVKDIMLNNTNLRQLAKEEEFKRNNPGHFED